MSVVRKVRGFSLVEVIIAAAIFAGSVAVVIALMAGMARQGAETVETLAARRLPDAVKVELTRLASAGFDRLAAELPLVGTPRDEGFALVASQDTAEVQSLSFLPPASGPLPSSGQFFLVECWRFSLEPLRWDPAKAFLAIHVRVSWPYRLPGGTHPVPLSDRNQFRFSLCLNR